MNNITFNTIKKPKILNKNLISCSFFAMKVSYRNFSKYESYLLKFCALTKNLVDYTIRIYVDKTTKDNKILRKLMKKYNNMEVIEFECKQMLIDNYFHSGTFGTFVRYFPLFDKNDKHELIRINDIDLEESYFTMREEKKMEENNLDFFFLSFIGYFKPWLNPKLPLCIIGSFILSKKKFPEEIFFSYLQELINNDANTKIGKMILDIRKFTQYKYASQNTELPYGIDELFLNYYLYPFVIKQNIKYGILCKFFPINFLKDIKHSIKNYEKDLIEIDKLLSIENKIFSGDKNINIKNFVIKFYNLIKPYYGKLNRNFDISFKLVKKYRHFFYKSFSIILIPKM